jgi:hypothetical protein
MADKPDEHWPNIDCGDGKVNSVAIFKLANEIRVTNGAIRRSDIG